LRLRLNEVEELIFIVNEKIEEKEEGAKESPSPRRWKGEGVEGLRKVREALSFTPDQLQIKALLCRVQALEEENRRQKQQIVMLKTKQVNSRFKILDDVKK